MKWDSQFTNTAHIDVRLRKVPDGDLGSVALSIHGCKEVAKLSFQSTWAQLADEIEKAAFHALVGISRSASGL